MDKLIDILTRFLAVAIVSYFVYVFLSDKTDYKNSEKVTEINFINI